MISLFNFNFCSFSFLIFFIFSYFFFFYFCFYHVFILHFVNFHFLIVLIVFFSVWFFHFISFRNLKRNQMKITWPRVDVASKINHDGWGLTYACTAPVCWIKRCKEIIYISFVPHERPRSKYYFLTKNMAPGLSPVHVIST